MDKDHAANYVVCEKDYPTYIYVSFTSEKLIRKFGEEICIHSDGTKVLDSNVHTTTRLELFNNIFSEVQKLVELKINNEPPVLND